MPATNLTATGATEWVNLIAGAATPIAVSGTFVGTVAFEVRVSREGVTLPLSRDLFGTPMTFTAPSGMVLVNGMEAAPDAQIRANCTAFTSGTLVVQIGR